MLKELCVSLAIEWNQNALPQIQAEDLCYQLILYTADLGVPGPKRKRAQILREANELYGSASSYGDLLASLYSLIFEEGFIRDKNVSANELCEYTLNYIREKLRPAAEHPAYLHRCWHQPDVPVAPAAQVCRNDVQHLPDAVPHGRRKADAARPSGYSAA